MISDIFGGMYCMQFNLVQSNIILIIDCWIEYIDCIQFNMMIEYVFIIMDNYTIE